MPSSIPQAPDPQEIPIVPIDPNLLTTTPDLCSISLPSNHSSTIATPPQPPPCTQTLTPNFTPLCIEPAAAGPPAPTSNTLPALASFQGTPSLANEIPASRIKPPEAVFTLPTLQSTPSITDSLPISHVEPPVAALPQVDEVASIDSIEDVQTWPYTTPRKQPTPAGPSASGQGHGGHGRRKGKGKGKGSSGKRGGQQGRGSRVGGEGGDPNDENVPTEDPDVVQVHLLTAAQCHQITGYNKMLQNILPNIDGMYPLMNFGPPPSESSSVPNLSKCPHKASKLGDGSAAYLVPSTEDLEIAEEIRKQKAVQQALKQAANVVNPGHVAKQYSV